MLWVSALRLKLATGMGPWPPITLQPCATASRTGRPQQLAGHPLAPTGTTASRNALTR